MTTPSRPPVPQRRAHPRFDVRLAVEISLPGGKTTAAVTRDLSAGGACVESAYALEDGAKIGVSLFVVVDGVEEASLPPLRVRASVQWTAHNEEAPVDARHIAGLQFEPLTDAQASWIARFART